MEARYPQSWCFGFTYAINTQGEKNAQYHYWHRVPLAEVSSIAWTDHRGFTRIGWLTNVSTLPSFSVAVWLKTSMSWLKGANYLFCLKIPLSLLSSILISSLRSVLTSLQVSIIRMSLETSNPSLRKVLQNENQNVLPGNANIAFELLELPEKISWFMDEKVFMNTFLNIRKVTQGSNVAQLSSFSVINDFDYQGQKYITIWEKEQFGDRITTQYMKLLRLKRCMWM